MNGGSKSYRKIKRGENNGIMVMNSATILRFYTRLHSKADRGDDEESTQAYVLVRRGA